MSDDRKRHLADLLIAARRDGRQIANLDPELVPPTHADGIAVNSMVADGLGWDQLGWKIAATNAVMQ
jgi:2-keto-4-pentenoate hydratase